MAGQIWGTVALVLSRYLRNKMLAAIATRPAAALWPTPVIQLSKDPAFQPTQDSDLTTLELEQADFTGYTAQTPVPAGPYNDVGNSQVEVATVIYVATTSGSFVGNSITGYWLSDGTTYLGGEAFGTNNFIVIAQAGDYIEIDLAIPFYQLQIR